jgi:hypothetical protein
LFQRLGRVALVAAIVVILGSLIAYNAEHATNPEYATFGDSLWWGRRRSRPSGTATSFRDDLRARHRRS